MFGWTQQLHLKPYADPVGLQHAPAKTGPTQLGLSGLGKVTAPLHEDRWSGTEHDEPIDRVSRPDDQPRHRSQAVQAQSLSLDCGFHEVRDRLTSLRRVTGGVPCFVNVSGHVPSERNDPQPVEKSRAICA